MPKEFWREKISEADSISGTMALEVEEGSCSVLEGGGGDFIEPGSSLDGRLTMRPSEVFSP